MAFPGSRYRTRPVLIRLGFAALVACFGLALSACGEEEVSPASAPGGEPAAEPEPAGGEQEDAPGGSEAPAGGAEASAGNGESGAPEDALSAGERSETIRRAVVQTRERFDQLRRIVEQAREDGDLSALEEIREQLRARRREVCRQPQVPEGACEGEGGRLSDSLKP